MIIPSLKKRLQRSKNRVRVICILGMHRSGTSYLTGSLQQAGLELHTVHEQNPHNRKGNRENPAIMRLNDWVLDSNGGSWDKPPVTVAWSDAQLAQAKDIIAQYAEYSAWGFKDPRVLITLSGWRQLLPDMEFAGIHRHPALVANSLIARNEKITFEAGIALWLDYNTRLWNLYEAEPFPLIHFDPASTDMNASVQNLAQALNLPGYIDMDFYDRTLLNQASIGSVELPRAASDLHDRLCRHSNQPFRRLAAVTGSRD